MLMVADSSNFNQSEKRARAALPFLPPGDFGIGDSRLIAVSEEVDCISVKARPPTGRMTERQTASFYFRVPKFVRCCSILVL